MFPGGLIRLRPRAFLPPIWREIAALEPRSSVAPRALGLTREGSAVLVIPGLLSDDSYLSAIATSLRDAGFEACPAGVGRNVDCSEAATARLVSAVERLADRSGGPIALVGHSRGGLLARVIARRRPELVSGVVTLATPHRDPLAVHPLLWAGVAALATLGTLGLPGLFGWGCATATCCEGFWRDLEAPFPQRVGLLSVYSRADGLVDWRACTDPAGRHLETRATHCGMVRHAPTLWEVTRAIEEFTGAVDRPVPSRPASRARAA